MLVLVLVLLYGIDARLLTTRRLRKEERGWTGCVYGGCVCVCVYSQCGVWVSKSELSVPAECVCVWRVDGGGDSSGGGWRKSVSERTYRDGGGEG